VGNNATAPGDDDDDDDNNFFAKRITLFLGCDSLKRLIIMRFILKWGRSAHLTYHVHKGGRKHQSSLSISFHQIIDKCVSVN